ncbi:hypothetical protein QN395_19070 [Undibacterium sp. RTI2.2]|nr:hypothetical protein [Undibacterium sp. RTI2.2]
MTPKKIFLMSTIFCRHVLYFVLDQWKSVLFSAALAGIFEHIGLLKIFIKFSWLLVAGMAAQNDAPDVSINTHTPIVVTIGEERFFNNYGEKRPLDRCVMRQDIAAILAKGTQRLAIDFDLSPLTKPNSEDKACQTSLDDLLDREAKRIVILTPYGVKGDLKKPKHAWMLERCAKGVHFGDGSLDKSLGMVNEQFIGEDEILQSRFAEQLHNGFNFYVCMIVQSARGAQDNPWLKTDDEKIEESFETSPINFSAVQKQLAVFDLGSQEFSEASNWGQNPVFFGGDWGRDDTYLTPLGKLAGVIIHGARFVSLEHPIKSFPPALGLMIDMGIAFCFAWVVGQFWKGYVIATRFDMQIRKLSRGNLRTAIGTVVIVSFIVIYLLLVIYFIFASVYFFLEINIMLAPLLMAISILFDGFVSAPIEQIQKLLEENEERERKNKDKSNVQEKNVIENETGKEQGKFTHRLVLSTILSTVLCTMLAVAINNNWIQFSTVAGYSSAFVILGLGMCLVVGVLAKLFDLKRRSLKDYQVMSRIRVMHAIKKLLPFKMIPEASPKQQYRKYNTSAVKLGYFFSWLRSLIFWGIIVISMKFMFL